ncbi:type IV pilus assembly protein PilY1 [Cupriavidus sp. YR651]|uniref:pilus assembly protein n=1 Tax=Cupriavidus sp. YR651 TaxID=1855315 RepID=UPI000886AE91|nr:pilus assembly protein [Cupriavidus sp. YR651]SDC20408.1 type IV pilus assembly protein PilY1 [Cupriavidus sp. YR651]
MKIIQRLAPVCAMLWSVMLAAAPASVPTVSISSTPLYGQSQNIHPNLMLTLSVEFPTTGAAYRGAYDKSAAYLGYFNNTKCYTYDATNGYFKISGNATSDTHECSGDFSGNFMNWAASSAIDELRLAMTGGDRVIDTRTQTVLQRALLQGDFFKSGSYFPLKSINGGGTNSAPSKVTPFNYSTLYMASCGNHIFFSDADGTATCASLGKYADVTKNGAVTERRGFRVQVQVCDSNEATTRTDLCYSYDGTNYKPVGEMQRNADRVRFAAFGYLNDGTKDTSKPQNERYGGVLRAPMKYVGDNAVNTSLNTITNPAKEWDTYGVLLQNPLNITTNSNSGVINYLNKFGRTMVTNLGQPTDNPLGAYKTFDPLGELYYESIRYLQFHPNGPTPEAINNLTTAYADNFPVYTTWDTDPMLNSCQRNYVLTIGDINTHQDHYIPGNSIANQGDPARPKDTWSNFDVVDWTNRVGALETNTPAAGNSNPLGSAFTSLGTKNHPTSSNSTYYMAGVAYWAHTSAFRPTMPEARVTTFGIDVNENGNGTVGDTQKQSQIFLAAKYGGFKEETTDGGNKDGNPFKTLGTGGTVVTNNTEWEAAPTGSGIPSNWFLASQPAKMISAIKQIFTQITSSAGTLSGVALSSSRIIQNEYVYTPGFDQQWNGKLTAYPLVKASDGTVSISSTQVWEASSRLASKTFSTRSIFTTSSTTNTGAAFAWSNLGKAQQDALNLNPGTGTSDGRGQQRVDYLRGDRSQEGDALGNGGIFRARKTVFGDIINSGPAYVGAPSTSRYGTGYSNFLSTYVTRTPMVYVGANDGMLHGFNATTGDEVFAYVPNAVMGNLNQLTSPTYVHRAYVDATPVISEAQIGGTWKSVLTGGFGGGAQGVYALDVTDPTGSRSGSAFGASNVIWEFTDKDDADMGNVMGTPVIAKLQTGTDSSNLPVYKWFVIVGNGLNSNQADGAANDRAPGVLFILSLDKAPGTGWSLNGNYWKIVTPSPSATPPYTSANGLSTPAMISATNGSATALYAGDLQGNLWKFVVSGLPSTWNGNTNGALPVYGGTPGRPLFVATSTSGVRQPITMQPQVVYAPGGYMVLFGTGKYYELADTNTNATQSNSFYGIYDSNGTNFVSNRSQLNQLTLTSTDNGKSIAFSGSTAAPGYVAPRKPGWVIDFLDPTERQITAAVVSGGLVYFNSIYTATGTCGTAGGSRSYALNTLTGMPTTGVSGYLSSIGLLGAPSIIITNVVVGDRGSIGGLPQTTTTQVIGFGTSGAATTSPSTMSKSRPGRLTWREVRNFKIPN